MSDVCKRLLNSWSHVFVIMCFVILLKCLLMQSLKQSMSENNRRHFWNIYESLTASCVSFSPGSDGPVQHQKSVDSFSFLHHPVHQRSLEILQRCKDDKYSKTAKPTVPFPVSAEKQYLCTCDRIILRLSLSLRLVNDRFVRQQKEPADAAVGPAGHKHAQPETDQVRKPGGAGKHCGLKQRFPNFLSAEPL